jgi:carbamoyltransferase
MKILGIHYGHDANVGLLEDGEVTFAISEERLNRRKFFQGFPFLSIQKTLEYTGLQPDNIDLIALINANAQEEPLGGNLNNFYLRTRRPVPRLAKLASPWLCVADNLLGLTIRRRLARKLLLETMESLGFRMDRIRFVDHHLAHAAGTFYSSGFPEALVLTSDGKGDHVSHRTYWAGPKDFELLHESSDFDSAGFFYSCITAFLGFKKLRHEGKITGLAAYGDFEKVSHILSPLGLQENATSLRNLLISEAEANNIYRVYWQTLKENPRLLYLWLTSYCAIMSRYSQYRYETFFKEAFNGTPREHVAAYAQRWLEENLVGLVRQQIEQSGPNYVCLSGGTFGNVRLNQIIAELEGVRSIYIQPAMGDGGLGVGGAQWLWSQNGNRPKPRLLEKVYLGPLFSDDEVLKAIKQSRLPYERLDNIEQKIATLLASGTIVGRFLGRMEWGPRALGNRSILVQATDPAINQTLNKRLKRTEFMPFAPIILEEHAKDFFVGYDSSDLAARFMTITYNVFEHQLDRVKAVIHVDQTARPQVVRKSDNPSIYQTLRYYYDLTGLPMLINTSFNMHEEPIVCTPEDAIRAFKEGAVDVLALENYLVQSP